MDSKKQSKHSNYYRQLFLPLVVLLLTIIGALLFFHHNRHWIESEVAWTTIALLCIAILLITLWNTHRIGCNIKALRQLANQAANGKPPIDITFPNDELGEISQKILRIYNQKDAALEKGEKEHSIAIKAIEEKSLLKRQMNNNVNHELKTPVGIIKGYLDTIMDNPSMDCETQRSFIEKTQQHVVRLCALLNDVSTITRLDEAQKIPIAEVNMHDLAYSLSNDAAVIEALKKMRFIYNIPANCTVKGNHGLLCEALLNLMRNAAVYSGGTQMVLELVGEDGDFCMFSFYDDGVGVSEQHLPHIFDRFYRVDVGRSRKMGGTGLGLPIVRNTINALGGTISAKNRKDGGLQFYFTLPKWA